MENLALGLGSRKLVVDTERSSIPDTVLADLRPVGVCVIGLVRKSEVRAKLWLCGGDGCAHETCGCVDEEADWGFAVGEIRNGNSIEGAGCVYEGVDSGQCVENGCVVVGLTWGFGVGCGCRCRRSDVAFRSSDWSST
jgi:hypothetical protein